MRRLAWVLLYGALLLAAVGTGSAWAVEPAAPRAAGLPQTWRNAQARRTVFFVGGMSCRACTLLLDRKLAETEGIVWSRFNYPLRLLIVYHDPRRVSTGLLREMVTQGELKPEVLESNPADGYSPGRPVAVAAWKGGRILLDEGRGIPERFHATLKNVDIEPGGAEYHQIAGEIVGEEVRRRIFAELAAAAGFATGPVETVLPSVLAREFYYPADALRPTPTEAGIALFLLNKVMIGDEGDEGRSRYESWLRDLWKEVRLDFRPEYLETVR